MQQDFGVPEPGRYSGLPEVEPQYAGYVAWRGTLEEDRAPKELIQFFDQSFTASEARSVGHILCYFIPGPNAAAKPGRRQLNWVWYVPVAPGPALKRLLTDKLGKLHGASVPAGMAPNAVVSNLHRAAANELHPRFVELVRASPEPFIQAIFDVQVPRMVFGRVCLLGDAAFVLRPHAAMGTAKAAGDATTLAAALNGAETGDALQTWNKQQVERGRSLVNQGTALGRRSVERRDGTATLDGIVERLGEIARPQWDE